MVWWDSSASAPMATVGIDVLNSMNERKNERIYVLALKHFNDTVHNLCECIF